MNNRLLAEFEEFEGLTGVPFDDIHIEDNNDDDPSQRPSNAMSLLDQEVTKEVVK